VVRVETDYTDLLPVEVRWRWPWGLALVHDSEWSGPPPSLEDGPVATSSGELVLAVQHEQEGGATIQLALDEPTDLVRVAHAVIEVPSAVLAVSDALKDRSTRVRIGAGLWKATVWMDEPKYATRIVISLARFAAGSA
jgi:hypothetical protein